jgi:hypothetical protein
MPYPTVNYSDQLSGLSQTVQNVGIAADAVADWAKLKKEFKDFNGLKERYKGEVLTGVSDPRKREVISANIDKIKDKSEFMEKVVAYSQAKLDWEAEGITAPISFGFSSDEYKRQMKDIQTQQGKQQAQQFTSQALQSRQVSVPAGAPDPEVMQSQMTGRLPEGQVALPTPPQIVEEKPTYERYIQDYSKLSPEAQKMVPTQLGETVKSRADAEQERAEVERQSGLVGKAETRQEAYGALAEGKTSKVASVIDKYIMTLNENKQQQEKADIELNELIKKVNTPINLKDIQRSYESGLRLLNGQRQNIEGQNSKNTASLLQIKKLVSGVALDLRQSPTTWLQYD